MSDHRCFLTIHAVLTSTPTDQLASAGLQKWGVRARTQGSSWSMHPTARVDHSECRGSARDGCSARRSWCEAALAISGATFLNHHCTCLVSIKGNRGQILNRQRLLCPAKIRDFSSSCCVCWRERTCGFSKDWTWHCSPRPALWVMHLRLLEGV